jgi:hypothetical protein
MAFFLAEEVIIGARLGVLYRLRLGQANINAAHE